MPDENILKIKEYQILTFCRIEKPTPFFCRCAKKIYGQEIKKERSVRLDDKITLSFWNPHCYFLPQHMVSSGIAWPVRIRLIKVTYRTPHITGQQWREAD